MMVDRERRLRRLLLSGAGALATLVLFFVSCGKWSDAIIDSGREWIVPDALSRGEVLYRDVVYWFGPFTPYFHAAFFRAFGSNFRVLVAAGSCGAAGVLVALYFALRQVTDRQSSAVWATLAIPLLVFMPHSGGAILGMGFRMWHAASFGLLAVTLAIRQPSNSWAGFGAGLAAGIAGLCRTEWGLAALFAAGVALVLRYGWPSFPRAFGGLSAGFVLAFGGGIGYFLVRAGPTAILHDAPILLFGLPEETRLHVAAMHPSAWGRGAIQMVYGALTWLAAFVLLDTLALSRDEPAIVRRRLPRLGILLLLAGSCAVIAGFPSDVLLSGAPLLCAASFFLGARRPADTLGAALGGFGVLGLLTSYRRPFFIADGPYVGPPLAFALVCAAGCLSLALDAHEPQSRRRLRVWLVGAVGGLTAALFAVRALQYGSDDRIPIAGTGNMLSARLETARQIEYLAGSIRRSTSRGEGVVIFPEGEVLNFLSDRPNPVRHKLYLPGYLNRENEKEILDELDRARPAAVVIWPRSLGEYGPAEFGVDYATSIRSWIRRNYVERSITGNSGRPPILAMRRRE